MAMVVSILLYALGLTSQDSIVISLMASVRSFD